MTKTRITAVALAGAGALAAGALAVAAPVAAVEDVVQQVGLPASGSCADVVDDAMNWAGVASGGWARSWAQWVHDGRGGDVCTRTLTYSDAMEHWMVLG